MLHACARNFEEAIKELETLVKDVESGNICLEQSIIAYERGDMLGIQEHIAGQMAQTLYYENGILKSMKTKEKLFQSQIKQAATTMGMDNVSALRAIKSAKMMEMMQMNIKPMMITIIPLMLIFYFVLPQLFSYTVALSPIPLNVIPGDWFELTCTAIKVEEGAYCQDENALYLWAWYFLSSIAFSGLIMKLTKTQMDLG